MESSTPELFLGNRSEMLKSPDTYLSKESGDKSIFNEGLRGSARRRGRPHFGRRSAGSKPSANRDANAYKFETSASRSCNSAKHFSLTKSTAYSDGFTNGKSAKLNQSIDDLEKTLRRTCISDSLEDSWNYLQIFNMRQKGRLGTNENTAHEKTLVDSSTTPKQSERQDEIRKNIGNKREIISDADKITEPTLESPPSDSVQAVKSKINVSAANSLPRPDFIIPELPEGRFLEFNIKTTWGDKHYLGLNGIEIFNAKGTKVKVKSVSINLIPTSLYETYLTMKFWSPSLMSYCIDYSRPDRH